MWQYVKTYKQCRFYFSFILLPWLSNKLLWRINKLIQDLCCTIWLWWIKFLIYWLLLFFNAKVVISGLRQFVATKCPLKMMKNAFYFTSKPLFVLKIFNFLFLLFWSCSKTAWLEGQGSFVIYTLSNISRSKENQTMKFGHFIENNLIIIFIEKWYTKCDGETSPRPLSQKLKLSISLDQ